MDMIIRTLNLNQIVGVSSYLKYKRFLVFTFGLLSMNYVDLFKYNPQKFVFYIFPFIEIGPVICFKF